MKLHFSSEYEGAKRKNYPFPSDDMPQKAKKAENYRDYCLKAAQAIVTRYINNTCEIPYGAFDGRESIETLRAYAVGKQSIEKYKRILIGQRDANGCLPQNTWNIDWKPLDILPKKLGDVKGYMQKLKYDVIITAIDPMAIASKEMVKAATKLASNDLMSKFHEELNELSGGMAVNPDGQLINQTAGAVPFQNESQVDSFAAIGGFQLLQEIAMKILVDKTQEDSGADILNDILIEDILQIGIIGKKHYSETGSDNVLWDAISIENAILPWSRYPDFRDAPFFGQIRRISIGELRRISKLSDAEIIAIAKKYNDASFNSANKIDSYILEIAGSKQQGLGINVLDSIMVDIADVEWLGTDETTQTSVTRAKEGNLAINTVDDDYHLSEADKKRGKELKKYTRQVVYQAKLILGTDKVFDYGLMRNMPYKKNEKGRMVPVMSYNFYKLSGPSLVEKTIGFVDDANLALYKKRMIIKNLSTGQNIKVNRSAFDNVKIDGKLQSPAMLMALFKDEGFLIVDDKNPYGGQTGSSRPIDIIPSDVAQRLMECRNEMEWNIKMIEEITGLNSIFSASTPSSETGLGVAKIAVNATENSIFTIIKAKENHFEQGLKINAHMWKVIAAYMDDDKRENFATDRALNYIKVGKELSWHDYGAKIEAGVTEDEKLMLMQKVAQLTDFRRQSQVGGIQPSDELMLVEIIKTGNIKLARMVLAQIEEFRAAQDQAKADRNNAQNAQMQQQSNEQATANKQAEIESEGEVKKSIKLAELQAEMQLEEMKGNNARKLAALQNVFGWSNDSYKKTVKQ